MNIQRFKKHNFRELLGAIASSSEILGHVLIRYNNILWIRKAGEVKLKGIKDTDMSG
jgi:hypothetical protein